MKQNAQILTLSMLLFINLCLGQKCIVASGNLTFTAGETFPIMQQIDTVIEVHLSVPKYEIPTEQPKPKPAKKQSFFDKIIALFKSLFKK